tara:strand:- start:821 stop:1006 length:186 start_codon:yes stop_codon:yes gene_type:complete
MIDITNIKTVKKILTLSGEEANLEVTLKDDTKMYVPKVTDNTDYQSILAWVADGNTIQDAD